jgi:F-type H+-transporting ATPase subunit delta
MAELATVARPYAEAAFRAALEAGALARWEEGLALARAIASDSRMASMLANPRLERAAKLELFFGIGGERLAPAVQNLVTILVEVNRASLLPEIAGQFEALKRAHESVLTVRIVTAMPLSQEDQASVTAALAARYGRRIEANVELDASLIGGVRIHVGDQVVHASVRDALDQMASALAR